MRVNVGWKWKADDYRLKTGCSICKSSPQVAFDERLSALPRNPVECGKLKLRTPGSPEVNRCFRRSPASLLYPAFSNRPFPNIFTQPLTHVFHLSLQSHEKRSITCVALPISSIMGEQRPPLDGEGLVSPGPDFVLLQSTILEHYLMTL